MQFEDLGTRGRGGQRPGAFVDVDFVGEVALEEGLVKWERVEGKGGMYGDDGFLAFNTQMQLFLLDVHI